MSDTVIVAVIVACTTVLSGIIGLVGIRLSRQQSATHDLVNSRLSELLISARALSRAEGIHEGEQSQRDRYAEPERASSGVERIVTTLEDTHATAEHVSEQVDDIHDATVGKP